jgi:hypothetical protein
MSHRLHGTRVKYVVDSCRCDACREANRVESAAARRQRLYGHPAYIDAEPARRHVRSLGAQGMGWKRVARAGGLSPSTLWKLMYGDPNRNRQPNKRIKPETSAAILAVELDLADGANIDATGTRRRLQGLVAIGYSQSYLAGRLGQNPGNFGTMFHHRGQVVVATARAVADLYDELSMTPRIATGPRTQQSITRAKNRATWFMWLPPLAWDDDDIDNPFATPAELGQDGRRDVVEDFDWLVDNGESPEQAAERLGVALASIERTRERRAA